MLGRFREVLRLDLRTTWRQMWSPTMAEASSGRSSERYENVYSELSLVDTGAATAAALTTLSRLHAVHGRRRSRTTTTSSPLAGC
jgi:hypothetical protein